MALKICLLVLACATVGLAQILGSVPGPELGPIYTLQTYMDTNRNLADRNTIMDRINVTESIQVAEPELHYEWENYDGWYNNPAHPEWGGAGKLHCAKKSLQINVKFGILLHIQFCGLHKNLTLLLLFVDFPLERKTPIVYEDGVYEIVAESRRGNVLMISNLTQHGLSGLGSARRTAFFTFFGMHKYIYYVANLIVI